MIYFNATLFIKLYIHECWPTCFLSVLHLQILNTHTIVGTCFFPQLVNRNLISGTNDFKEIFLVSFRNFQLMKPDTYMTFQLWYMIAIKKSTQLKNRIWFRRGKSIIRRKSPQLSNKGRMRSTSTNKDTFSD